MGGVIDPEDTPDPDLISRIWNTYESLIVTRRQYSFVEKEFNDAVEDLERTNIPIVELIKICKERLAVSLALKSGRLRDRPFTEIYEKVCLISKEIQDERHE